MSELDGTAIEASSGADQVEHQANDVVEAIVEDALAEVSSEMVAETGEDVDEPRGDVGELDDEGSVEEDDVFVLEEAPDPDSVLAVWEPTGHADVDSALEQLHELTGAELVDHVAIYERVESSLRQTLDGLAAEDESV